MVSSTTTTTTSSKSLLSTHLQRFTISLYRSLPPHFQLPGCVKAAVEPRLNGPHLAPWPSRARVPSLPSLPRHPGRSPRRSPLTTDHSLPALHLANDSRARLPPFLGYPVSPVTTTACKCHLRRASESENTPIRPYPTSSPLSRNPFPSPNILSTRPRASGSDWRRPPTLLPLRPHPLLSRICMSSRRTTTRPRWST